ncbi:MAG: HDOD domain-containing protein [Gammaproteobacteria bacterium]|nr:MAG: HDOD domain-containing protein [Gammaproteobacteria bacterium]
MLDHGVVEHIVNHFFIPPRPDILMAIQEACRAEDPDIDHLATLVSRDITLSAAVLKLLNSPFFGFRSKIENIKQAAMMLGTSGIESIATAVLLKRAFAGQRACIPMDRFWEESQQSADLMYAIGQQFQLERYVPLDRLYTLGLFFNTGSAAFAIRFDDYHELIAQADQDNSISLIELEEQHYKTDHATVGYILGRTWGLTNEVLELILEHHSKRFFTHTSDIAQRVAWAALWLTRNVKRYVRHRDFLSDYDALHNSIFELLGMTESDFIDLAEDAEQHFSA